MKPQTWRSSRLMENTTDPCAPLWSCEMTNDSGEVFITIGAQDSQTCIDLMREVKSHLNSPKGIYHERNHVANAVASQGA